MSSLAQTYDVAMLDLDGVVYVGPDAVPGAAEHIAAAREAGMRIAFITNNASRPPSAVSAHLTDLGVVATDADVVTSAQAAARVLVDRLGPGAKVALLGGLGLRLALEALDLEPVTVDDDRAVAVVSGYGPEVMWRDVMRAAVRVRDGLWWVASNTDASIPTPYGVAPGHGVLVDTLRRFSGVDPVVAGKPERPLLDETVRRMAATRPLMVGDRLDTDIAGGVGLGIDTLLVMTGVTGLETLVSAVSGERPTFVAADLSALVQEPVEAWRDGEGWQAGGWRVRGETTPSISGTGTPTAWWQALAAWGWAVSDDGRTPDVRGVRPPDHHER